MSLVSGTWLGFALALAQAPSAEEVGCVLTRVSEPDRALIVASIATGELEAAAHQRLSDSAIACARPAGTGQARFPTISMAALATIGRDRLRDQLGEYGIDAATVDRWFAGQSEVFRVNWEMTDAEAERVPRELHAAGIPAAALQAHGETLGQYLASMMVLERLRLGLAIE